jgi:WD repeat-containing protein 89
MISMNIHKAIVTSFDRSPTTEEGDSCDGAQDGGVYVFDVDCVSDKSAIVASSSDNCLSLYDTESLIQIRRIHAHSQMINGFNLSKSGPYSIYSASNDHHINCWDLRSSGDTPVIKIKLPDEVTALSVGMADTLLAAGCSSSVSFHDLRIGSKKSNKLGEYSDVHTDTVTQLKFSTANAHILASGAEDGLIGLYNTSTADGDDAVSSILNTECPVRRIGYFGNNDEAMYCLSTTETASFWHCSTAQRVGDFPDIRAQLEADYLVDCMYDGTGDTLTVLAGSYGGSAKIAVVEPTALRVIGQLTSEGHRATIRCSKNYTSNSLGMMRIVTGGEDSRLCSWNVLPAAVLSGQSDIPLVKNFVTGSGSSNSNLKSATASVTKNNRRQKPY